MSTERAAMLREMMRGPPPPIPPMRMSYSDPSRGPFARASELVNYVDHDGKSAYREPYPEEQRARD